MCYGASSYFVFFRIFENLLVTFGEFRLKVKCRGAVRLGSAAQHLTGQENKNDIRKSLYFMALQNRLTIQDKPQKLASLHSCGEDFKRIKALNTRHTAKNVRTYG